MSEVSTIGWLSWRDFHGVWMPGSTWNIWRGCREVHKGCAECYARRLIETRLASMTRQIYRQCGVKDWETCPLWGDRSPRVRPGRDMRTMPLLLQKKYAKKVSRFEAPRDNPRVFLGSLMDWLDDCPAGVCDLEQRKIISAVEVLSDALDIIRRCPDITFICVTKRPQDWYLRMQLCREWMASQGMQDLAVFKWIQGEAPRNVWFIASVSDQATYDEILPHVLEVPAVVRGLSAEPLLGQITLKPGRLHWIISGVESGPNRREQEGYPARANNLIEQCAAAGIKCFHKQMPIGNQVSENPKEWPAWARVQQFPL